MGAQKRDELYGRAEHKFRVGQFTDNRSRKPPKRAVEPVDEWLQNDGYFRKHTPKDPTCLFRAVSEQVYHSQRCHIKVRQECIEFMKKNRQLFEEKISIPYDSYLNQMACFTEWGGTNEILAISSLYKRNIVIFHGQKFTKETVVDHGHKENLLLCFTPPKQYETVMSREYTAKAGFCQSIVYQTLYKKVFKMNNVDAVVHKMLHERNTHLRHDKFFLQGNLEIRDQLTEELMSKLDENIQDSEELQLLSRGITSFPYRVAKALDPNIYRNVDFDIWHEIRRDVRNSGYTKFNPSQLQAGSKCLVQIDSEESDRINNNFVVDQENSGRSVVKPKNGQPIFYTGHIQEMGKNDELVLVFVEGLGKKMRVPYESLKPFPYKKIRHNSWLVPASKKNLMTQNVRWRRPGNTMSHRMKFHLTNSVLDKNEMNATKTITTNVMSKSEWKTETILDNHSIKLQGETYTSYQEYSVNAPIDSIGTILENTHISSVEMVEQEIYRKSKDIPKTKDETRGPIIIEELNNNFGNESDQSPDEKVNQHFDRADLTHQDPGSGIVNESLSHQKAIPHVKSWRNKRQSPPRKKNPDCIYNDKQVTQKLSPRMEYRNSSSTSHNSHQPNNLEANKYRADLRNFNSSDDHTSNNKESQRGDKSSGLAPRFRRNYEGEEYRFFFKTFF
ncbi:hypothetical protein QAD02_022460 [Eretmocerus hayati]|uniref:Uncharacterized protein n=1 Tax=Eretmocerus hayati TaxID=131215 RepID=A0ACC2PV58_9HYME|nr:hypothetical protein QAD02_022460 [Eretmocerus hayati]